MVYFICLLIVVVGAYLLLFQKQKPADTPIEARAETPETVGAAHEIASKKCKHCAMMIPEEAKICPHCRKTLGWTWPAKIAVAIIVLTAIISFQIKTESDTPKSKPVSPRTVLIPTQPTIKTQTARAVSVETPERKEAGLSVVGWNWERGEYNHKYISGTVKNNTPKSYNYAQISFNLYDNSDAQVGTAWSNINNLEPFGTWKFKAIVLQDNAIKAKLSKISAF